MSFGFHITTTTLLSSKARPQPAALGGLPEMSAVEKRDIPFLNLLLSDSSENIDNFHSDRTVPKTQKIITHDLHQKCI